MPIEFVGSPNPTIGVEDELRGFLRLTHLVTGDPMRGSFLLQRWLDIPAALGANRAAWLEAASRGWIDREVYLPF